MKILRSLAVREKTGLPKSTMYLYIKEGLFPRPIKLGVRSSGWIEDEINEWLNQRRALRRPDETPNFQE